ncbi:MAG: PAS domain-containing protein [Chloroflexi bacterium]|nr:PAS domain-containing protein [Chloroflexota bacterium]
MEILASVYVILLFVNAVIELGLASYAWQHRQKAGVHSFIGFVLLAFGLTLSSLLTAVSISPLWRTFWQAQIRYLVLSFIPVFTLTFATAYTGRQRWLTWQNKLLISIVPIVIQLVNWFGNTNAIASELVFSQYGRFYLLDTYTRGAWFWIHTGYIYILLAIVFFLLIKNIFQQTQLYQHQSRLLLAGMAMPVIANFLATFEVFNLPQWDWTAISFTLTAVFWGRAFFRYNLLNIMPVARDAVMESMEDAVIVLDTEKRVVDLNPAAQRLIGRPFKDVIGHSALYLFENSPGLLTKFHAVSSAETEIEVSNKTYDLRISTLLKNNNRPMGQLVVLRDITTRKQEEIERERLISELDAYAHTVAHDLKSPLALIIGYSDIALLTPELPNILQEPMQTIMQTSRKMSDIVNELLLLSTVRTEQQLNLTPLPMHEIMTEVLGRMKKQIRESNTQLQLPNSWPTAIGYAPWVEEIWVNYLSNAIKYGGSPPHIEFGATSLPNNTTQFWVQDNGYGLNEEEQSALFTPFTRLEQTKPHIKGHGLGLSIVQRIITKLNGEAGVTSQIGEGSRFYFTLPEE